MLRLATLMPCPISFSQLRPLDLALQDDELVSKHYVLGDQLSPTTCQIRYGTECRGYPRRTEKAEQPGLNEHED